MNLITWIIREKPLIMSVHRGAEAGGILGVNTPHFFGLTTPTFWRDLKMGAGERCSKS